MRLILSVFLIFCGFAAITSGAERTCRIVILGMPDNTPEKMHLFTGKSSQVVELSKWDFSPVYKLPEETVEVSLLDKPCSKPEDMVPGTPRAAVARDIADFFLLVTSDPANKTVPLRLQVINANSGTFKPGEMMCYNLTPYVISGKVGKEQLAIAANSKAVIPPPASGNEDYQVSLTYKKGDERPSPLIDTKWTHNGTARVLLFVISQAGNPTPQIMGFPDRR